MIYKDLPLATSYGELTGNRSLDRTLLTFQTFVLNRWSWIENDMIRAGIKKGDAKKSAWMAVMLIIATLAETGIRAGAKNLINFMIGQEDEEDQSFWGTAAMNAVGNVPFINPVVLNRSSDLWTGINIIDQRKRITDKRKGSGKGSWRSGRPGRSSWSSSGRRHNKQTDRYRRWWYRTGD